MPTQTPQPETRPTASQFEQYVERQLESTRQQVKLTEVTAGLLSLGLWVLGFLLVGVLIDSWLVQFGPTGRLIVFLLLAAGAAWIAWTQVIVLFVRRIHRLYAARMIEEGSENFHNSIVNYLQVKEGGQVEREAIVQAISQRAARDLSKISATEKVDRSLPIKLGFGLVALVGLLVGYTLLSPKSPWPSIARILNPVSSISAPSFAEVVNVTPGSTDVFFGQKLLVTAEIRGRHNSDDVRLVYSTTDGQQVDVPRAMQPSGKGNSYQLELSTTPTGIDGPLHYYVIANDGRSPTYTVNVKPNPAITLQKFEVIPPTYTRLPARTVEGQTEIEGLEGSQVKLTAAANLPIQVAWIELLRQKTRGRETAYEVVRTIELRNLPPSSDESGAPRKHTAEGEFFLALDANRTGQLYTHYQMQFRTVDGERNPLVNVQPLKVRPDLAPVVNVVRPFDREVAVPLNRALEIELQAEDQDFEISRLQLLLDHQGGRLLDEEVELGDNRNQQRLSANYRFDPRKLQLSVGDEVIFHARASDNRLAVMSGQPDPNVTRTENYSIKITEPLETEIAQDQPDEQAGEGEPGNQTAGKSSKPDAQAGNSSSQTQPESSADSEQANNPPAGKQESQAGKAAEGDAQSAMSEANPGKSSADQPKQNNPGEKSPEEQPQPPGDQEKTSDQPAEKTEQPQRPADNKSSGESSGEQKSSQASGSSGESSKQSAQGEGENPDQQEKKNQGDPSGEAQANPEANEKQMGQGGQPKPSGDPKQSAQQGAQNQAQADQSGKPETPQSPPGEQSGAPQQPEQNQTEQQSGSGQQGGGKSSQQGEQAAGNPAGGNQASSENAGKQNAGQDAESASSQGNNQNQKSGQQAGGKQDAGRQDAGRQDAGKQDAGKQDAGKQDAGKQDANQPGESGGESAGQPSDALDSQPDGEPSASNEEPLDKSATDAERFQRLQERLQRQRQSRENPPTQDPAESGGQENQKSARENQSGENQSGENQSGENQSGENQPGQNQTGKQDAAQPQSQKPAADGQPEPGDQAQQQGNQPEGQPQPGKQGAPKSAGNSANQSGKQDSPNARPQTEQPSTEKSGEQADPQGSQQGGSGEPGKQQSGSTDDSQAGKQGGSAEKSSQQSGQAGSSQQSGESSRQSSGQSDSESKQSGDGQPGGSKQGGSGSQGNSQSKQSGQASSKTGQPGGESTGESGSSGNASGADNATASQSELSKRKDQPNDQQSSSGETNPQGTGKAGSNAAPSQDYSDAPEQAEGNLDYSRQATDLVLDELRNQANKPDPELLKEMNWTEQDLKDFISRWEAMKQKAGGGAPQERKRYEDALRSLGLRPEPVRRNIIKSRRDELNKLSEDGAVNRPPANLADEFNAFLKNRNRVQKNK